MPKVDHLAKLLKAVAAHDWDAARAAGLEIAASEEKIGHHSAAQHLRGAMNPNGHAARPANPSNGTVIGDPGFLAAALTRVQGDVRLVDVELRPAQRRELMALSSEWKHRDALAARHVERRRKLLFFGPPGCGKSMTAAALGVALGLPTFVVRMDAVVGAFLGQTALRIRELFRFAETTACVLLLDEIDALAKKRGSPRDVGELDRVVISLMQELEHAVPEGLVVATSNVPDHLDEALFRRFDDVVQFPRPSRADIARFGSKRAIAGKIVPARKVKQLLVGATSYAEAARRITAEERSIVLRGATT
jgi:SpoVK/Ycf46/Vps4 family AAA+-type ATPase